MLKKLKKPNRKDITFILFILTNMDVGSYFWATPHSNFEPKSTISTNYTKKIGKVKSKRSKRTSPQKRSSNKVLYLGIFFTVLSLVLFICAHFLQIIFEDNQEAFWMGIEVSNIITDITLYLAVGLSVGMLILWISFHISKEGVLKR